LTAHFSDSIYIKPPPKSPVRLKGLLRGTGTALFVKSKPAPTWAYGFRRFFAWKIKRKLTGWMPTPKVFSRFVGVMFGVSGNET
jgi:hypothetical protein